MGEIAGGVFSELAEAGRGKTYQPILCVLNVLSSRQPQSQECIGTQIYRERKEV